MSARTPKTRLKIALALLLATGSGVLLAQDDDGGPQGYSMGDASGSYEVSGVEVDVTGKTAIQAREAGWRLAQRKGWVMLSQRLGGGGGGLSDGTLDAMVSGIVVENEQIGPNRYVARLGVLFNRGRAGSLLGVAGQSLRSSPMLVLPLQYSGGTGQIFEKRTDWAEAWTRYRTGNSVVDYVRPAGSGPDSLLLNLGQIGRPGRTWWRTILDQYGALDVLVPVVRLYRQWPGGPVIGAFEARHGPDNRLVSKFTLRVNTGDGLPALLDAGVKRIDESYQAALRGGLLNTDPGLSYVPPPPPGTVVEAPVADLPVDPATAAPTAATIAVNIQYDTPGVGAVSSGEAALRGIPGVRSAMTSSLALGGVSVMRVSFDGDPATLQAALEARGWTVQGAGNTLRIRRAVAPPPPAPAPADNATSG
ncbi:heavy-metal-associated domain-containing protein [Sphingomonas hylomeconis]|uniref:Heavy-metal-associated domain-containing protein n=1 Tax=Sphingomonas hylomeconis TaxID=1395958 RepID=A0ABV7SVB8_9SPHN|nr:heavy-metal-associated domain-containing protein [Sphingomonas hylomeconis]